MDWYQGARPWTSGSLTSRVNGVWAVEVEQDGTYRFELRRYPREAEKAHGAIEASVKVGEAESTVKATEKNKVTIRLHLKKGLYDLSALFKSDDGANGTWGAFFVYISHVSD